jgi:hypothetical protein
MLAIGIARRREPTREIYPGDWLIGKYQAVRLRLSNTMLALSTAALLTVGL